MLQVPTSKQHFNPVEDDYSFAAAKDDSGLHSTGHHRRRSRSSSHHRRGSSASTPSRSTSRSPSRSPSPHPGTPRGASLSPPKQAFVMDYEEDPLEQQMRLILQQTGVYLPDNLFEQQGLGLLNTDAVSSISTRSSNHSTMSSTTTTNNGNSSSTYNTSMTSATTVTAVSSTTMMTPLPGVPYPARSSPVLSDEASFPSLSSSPSSTSSANTVQRGRTRMDPETLQRLAASAPPAMQNQGGLSNLRHR
ncbi:hypothetical protein BGW41_005812 [Actinomortierella wolfii]|nr:hypothetical protein BGW41_005812 [Actinomortierella wolfii]